MRPLGSPDQVAKPWPEEPDAGNPHVRICEGGGRVTSLPYLDDSHADGGKSDMKRLVTLCLDRCQPGVHSGDIILRVEEDGTVTALDRDGNVIGKPRSAAEVLAEADESCPLETIERREPPVPEAAPEAGGAATARAAAGSEVPRTLDSLDDLPPVLTAFQWRALEERIEWSHVHRAFLFRPDGRDLAEFLATSKEVALLPPGRSAEPPAGIRPLSFGDFVGQRRVLENLLLAGEAELAPVQGETGWLHHDWTTPGQGWD